MLIRFLGDVHGKFSQYKRILKESPYPTIQVGDMGVGFRRYPHGDFEPNPPYDKMVDGGHRFIRGNHDCCDIKTECLTQRGWLTHDIVSIDDKILSLDESGVPGWFAINDIVRYQYSGPLIRVETERFSMGVTPNHRVLLVKNGMKFREADKLPSVFILPMAAKISQKDFSLCDDAISLVGWILTDGHFDNRNNSISIYQSKPQGQYEIECLLNRLGISYSKSMRQRDTSSICGRTLLRKPLPECRFLLHSISAQTIKGWVQNKKTLPQWAYHLSSAQFQVLLEAIVAGDGTWDGVRPEEKMHCVIYGSESLLSSIQAVAVCHGWRSRLAIDNRGDFRLCLTKRTTLYLENKKDVFREHYDGIVWCLRVKHQNFMVRRRGCAYFTGNSPAVCRMHSQCIKDGTVEDAEIMFIGGADSIDKQWRIPQYSWWPDEELSQEELDWLVVRYEGIKPNVMVTHDCPQWIGSVIVQPMLFKGTLFEQTRTREAFQRMFQIRPPRLWIFGHYHVPFDQVVDTTRFVCLSELEYKDFEVP